MRDALYKLISRHMLFGISIGLCWLGLSLSQASADGAAQQHRRVIVVWRLDATLEVADGLVIGDAGRLPDRRIKI